MKPGDGGEPQWKWRKRKIALMPRPHAVCTVMSSGTLWRADESGSE